MREVAHSMDFDLSKYGCQTNQSDSTTINGESTNNKNDSYDSVIKNISEMINVHHDDLD
jgi:tRNA A37 methylthiotransferase MiaB